MGPLIYLTMAYAAFWIIAFVFIIAIFNRQRHLQREISVLEQLLEQSGDESNS